MTRFAGKVALVTGGSSGIGQAIARRLSDNGARVFTAQRNHDQDFECVKADFSKPEAAASVVAQVMNAATRLDIIVNNAGVI